MSWATPRGFVFWGSENDLARPLGILKVVLVNRSNQSMVSWSEYTEPYMRHARYERILDNIEF